MSTSLLFQGIQDFDQQLKNLTNQMGSIDEQLTATRTKQLELSTELKSHGHGNKKQINDLTSELSVLSRSFIRTSSNISNLTSRVNTIDISLSSLSDTTSNVSSTMADISVEVMEISKIQEGWPDKIFKVDIQKKV